MTENVHADQQSSSISPDADLQQAYEKLRDLKDVFPRGLNARLSVHGFNDITGDGLLIMGAIQCGVGTAHALLHRLGITRQVVGKSIETLILRGYLEFQDNPDDPRQPTVVFTDRGNAAIEQIAIGLVADWWAELPRRSGDIIISTAPKSGTTWMQMICALLIFQTPSLPAPLQKLSPELDIFTPRAKLYAALAPQQHRRFMKTHMPLDELVNDQRVTYIVVARNPLDMVVSLYYQRLNFLPNPEQQSDEEQPPKTVRQWLLRMIDEMGTFPVGHDNDFDTILKKLSSAWERRADPNVVLVHYEDLLADLPGEMRRLAKRLGITVPEEKWPSLVRAATLKQMQAIAGQIQPMQYVPGWDASKGHSSFFRRGTSGEGRALLTEAEAIRYYTRAAQVAPPELLTWLHRDDDVLRNARATI